MYQVVFFSCEILIILKYLSYFNLEIFKKDNFIRKKAEIATLIYNSKSN